MRKQGDIVSERAVAPLPDAHGKWRPSFNWFEQGPLLIALELHGVRQMLRDGCNIEHGGRSDRNAVLEVRVAVAAFEHDLASAHHRYRQSR